MTRICVSVCEKNLDALAKACERASEWADVIELRLDCLLASPGDLSSMLERVSRPVILTFRPAEQG